MNHMSVLDIIINAIAAGAFVGFLVFVIIYSTRDWRLTDPGRSLMYAIGSLNLVVLLNTVHLFTGRYPGIEFVRIPVYTLLFFTAWRLVYSLVKTIRQGNDIEPVKLFAPKTKETTVKEFFIKAQGYAKFLVAMLGALLGAGSLLIPEEWGQYITLAISLLTAFSVYAVPNKSEAEIAIAIYGDDLLD